MKKYEPFDTTADIGLRVYGNSFKELLENAALGMFSFMVEPFNPKEEIDKEIEVNGDKDEDLLVSLLSEFIYLFETEGFILFDIKGKKISTKKYLFDLKGENYSHHKHTLLTHIKAVTYHNLKITKAGDIFKTEIVFDV